ncbi:MAG: hypothetical protein ACI9LV_000590 [Candidatus Nanohaloarchaea archaeon]|jgi:hypothetical protein
MSVVDDLKNTLGGSDNSSSRSNNRSSQNSSSFDGGDFDSDLGSGNDISHNSDSINPRSDQGPQQRSGNQSGRNGNSGSGQLNRHGNDVPSRDQSRTGNTNPRNQGQNMNQGNGQQRSGRNSHPNAQAGRPQQGSSSPQVSSQTQKKMENAGFSSGNQGQGRGRRNEPVSGQRNDFEELKSQNEQIIELLKRVNRNLEQLGR